MPAILDRTGPLYYNATSTRTITVGDMSPVDLVEPIRAWLITHATRGCAIVEHRPRFVITAAPTEDPHHWEDLGPHGFGLLVKPHGAFGFTNLDAYLTDWLQAHNRSVVRVRILQSRIECIPWRDRVPVLSYTHNNSCALDDAFVAAQCKPATPDTCAFLTMSGSVGWTCDKFGLLGRVLLDRALTGVMRAKRVAPCRCSGRVAGGTNTLESTVVKDGVPQPISLETHA